MRTRDLGFRASHSAQRFRVYRAVLGGYLIASITAGSGCVLIWQNNRTGGSRVVRTGDSRFALRRAMLGGYLNASLTPVPVV